MNANVLELKSTELQCIKLEVFSLNNKDGVFDGKNLAIYDWKRDSSEEPSYLENDLSHLREQRALYKNVTKICNLNLNKVQLNLYRVLYKKQEKLGDDVNIKMILFCITPTFKTIIQEVEIMNEVDELFEDDKKWNKLIYNKKNRNK